MKIKFVVTTLGLTLATFGCANTTSRTPAPAAKPALAKTAAVDECATQANPEITTGDGKEVTAGQIPAGEYDYVSGETYVHSQGANQSSFLEAFVKDGPQGSDGAITAQLACSQVNAKSAIDILTQFPDTQDPAPMPAASPAAGPAPASATAELRASLKLTVSADGKVVASGLRRVFIHKDEGQDQFIVVTNTVDAASTETTLTAMQSSATSPDAKTPVFTKYLLSDKTLTILVREDLSSNGSNAYNLHKIVMKKK